MLGKVKKIELKEFKTREGKKFKKVEITCDVTIDDKGAIKTLRCSYSEEFARRYLSYCNTTTKDLIGKEVECVVAKRKYENDKGEEKVVSFIRFVNILDEGGKAIIMPKDDVQDLDF